ncbi:MAG: SUMF1/EgtB/PvdO family nonheme iron enzyme, partial [Anaerolineae bacterium]|nr:SUMF1/EgtB/PvdO family nonheme iron enzyme [Anaerolineae bacterium]
ALFLFRGGASGPDEASSLLASNQADLPSSRRMVRIPAGTYSVGLEAADSEHAAQQEVELTEFWLDQYEATNAEYAQFLAATDNQPVPHSWTDGVLPAGQEDYPVSGITWEMAAAYCQWAQKRLPSEAEWEVAARGTTGALYPWGDDDRAVELPRAATYVGGSVAENRSPFGAFDMAGNVWEWVDEPYAPLNEGNRLLRGGAYGFVQDMAYRLQGDPNVPTMSATSGVRCAADQVQDDGGASLAGNVLFSDDFTDPESGWPVLAEEVGLFGYHPPDFYHVEVSIPEAHQTVTRGPNFDNVTVESDIFVEKFDTDSGDFRYGLVLHRSGDDYYAFTVSNRTQTWAVLKSSAAGFEVLAQGSSALIRGQGREQADQFRIDANNGQFTFWLNEQPLAQVRDAAYATGEVGFFLENFDQTMAHIHYDTLTIREVEPSEVVLTLPGVLASDDFTDPESGWPVLAEEVGLFGYHPPAFYHVEVSVPQAHQAVTRGPDFDNITVESDLFVEKTDTDANEFRYGLVLRRSGDNYYAFTISNRSQTWAMLKSSERGFEVLAQGSNDTIRGQNRASADSLRVDASGSDFIFHINGQPVTLVSDADYASGEVGFFVENFDETLSHIHYDTLTIREVEFDAAAVPPTPEPPTPIPTPTAASASDVIATPEPVPTEEAPEESGSSLSEINPAAVAEVETPTGMVLVPAGYFQMGAADGSRDEQPEHPVLLNAFFMDQYEVTEVDYQRCV